VMRWRKLLSLSIQIDLQTLTEKDLPFLPSAKQDRTSSKSNGVITFPKLGKS
jgi:hypothetical protein